MKNNICMQFCVLLSYNEYAKYRQVSWQKHNRVTANKGECEARPCVYFMAVGCRGGSLRPPE